MKKIREYKKYLLSSFMFFFPLTITVFAESEAVKSVNDLTDKLYTVIGYAGSLIAIYAMGMLIFSFRSENYDAMGKHIMQLCVGVTLIGLKGFIG